MAEANTIYQKAGLPVVTPDESEDFAQSLASLADPESLDGALMTEGADPSGGNTLETVYYINFNRKTSAELAPQLDALSANVNLSSQFMTVKANAAVASKVASKELPSNDETKKSVYKAKVVNHLANNAPWISSVGIQTQQKRFVEKKEDFHNALVKHFTQGLNLPDSIILKLENFLTNIKDLIVRSSDTSDSLTFFVLITLYQQDDVAKTWRPLGQTLSNYSKKKGDKSSGQNVDIHFEYVQSDGLFNNALFESNAKAGINQLVNSSASEFIKNPPIEVAVD
ncbi:hypothetical protein TMatcc_001474 [Talaromyces marneffei ATCC 18224]|uniref:Uncharacterized protein n=2 Tax=Talaromyces marneffei TaxID=37727 RepID=B6QGX9_TALMQ|nr:hypothetical protein PMAA_092570 [Talaromyces marneffei ATCC 18224]